MKHLILGWELANSSADDRLSVLTRYGSGTIEFILYVTSKVAKTKNEMRKSRADIVRAELRIQVSKYWGKYISKHRWSEVASCEDGIITWCG